MKVLLINGSPHREGCTFTALNEIATTLQKNGVESEIFQIGMKPIAGCIACGKCRQIGKIRLAMGKRFCYNEKCLRKSV